MEITPRLSSKQISNILHNNTDKIGDGKLNLNKAILTTQNL